MKELDLDLRAVVEALARHVFEGLAAEHEALVALVFGVIGARRPHAGVLSADARVGAEDPQSARDEQRLVGAEAVVIGEWVGVRAKRGGQLTGHCRVSPVRICRVRVCLDITAIPHVVDREAGVGSSAGDGAGHERESGGEDEDAERHARVVFTSWASTKRWDYQDRRGRTCVSFRNGVGLRPRSRRSLLDVDDSDDTRMQ